MNNDTNNPNHQSKLSRYGEPAHIILLSLASGPKHGYALTQDILSDTGIKLGPGTLYGAITKMAAQGLIEPVPEPKSNNTSTVNSRRRTYRITAQGREALNSYVATWSRIMDIGKLRLAGE